MASQPENTSPTLLERIRAHDSDAWQRFVRIYGPLIYGWARKAGLQASDAADIVQEVSAAVHRNVARFRRDTPTESFRGWLWTICRNKVRDHFRNRRSRPGAEGGTTANLRLQLLPETPAP